MFMQALKEILIFSTSNDKAERLPPLGKYNKVIGLMKDELGNKN